MRCSLKATSLGKMRGVENWSKTKKGLTAIGISELLIPLLYPQIILSVANYFLRILLLLIPTFSWDTAGDAGGKVWESIYIRASYFTLPAMRA